MAELLQHRAAALIARIQTAGTGGRHLAIGAIGIGTIIFSLLMGPSMQWGMQLFGLIPHKGARPAPIVQQPAVGECS